MMDSGSNYVDWIVRAALVGALTSLLEECTDTQQTFFAKLYPSGILAMTETDLRSAIGLVRRTLVKNRSSSA